jgi:hypothetical protein
MYNALEEITGTIRPTSRSSLGCTEVMRGGTVTASDYQTATEKVFRSVQLASHVSLPVLED